MTAGGRRRARNAVIALIVFAAFMHVFAYWMVAAYANANLASDTATLVGLTGTLVLSWSLLLSQAMELVTRAFYSRSDLDLILTSPASARKVFAVRMGRIATAAVAIAVLLAAPFINVLAFLGGSRWLGAYGVVAAMGAVATAAALALTIALFRTHRRQAYTPDRADRGGGDRRGLRHRPANRGDFFRRQPFPLYGDAIGLDAAACARRRQRVLVAGTRRARRLCRARRGPRVQHRLPGADRSRCSRAALASMQWPRPAFPAPPYASAAGRFIFAADPRAASYGRRSGRF